MIIPPGFTDPDGRPVNHDLLGRLMGAAFDGCRACQEPLLVALVEDWGTAARMVELACVAVAAQFGGIPSVMTDPDADGPTSLEFRQLAAAGTDGRNEAMWRACEVMTPKQRRAAVDTAVDIMTGTLMMAGAGLNLNEIEGE